MLPRKKIRNLRSSNCWKCIENVNLTITLLFLYHLRSHQADLFGPWGVYVRSLRTPPAYEPVLYKSRELRFSRSVSKDDSEKVVGGCIPHVQ